MAGYVEAISFGVSGDDENKRAAYGTVTRSLMEVGGKPVPDGLYDLLMGVTHRTQVCSACKHKERTCQGHPGVYHLNPAGGVVHPIMVDDIRRWLRLICLNCGLLLVDPANYSHLPLARRLKEAESSAGSRIADKSVVCPRCGTPHDKIVKDELDNFSFLVQPPGWDGSSERHRLTPAGDPHLALQGFRR